MWSNRWVRVGAVALGILLITGLARLFSLLAGPDEAEVPTFATTEDATALKVIGALGLLGVIALMAVAAAFWAVRHPFVRVIADLGAATLAGTALAVFIGPFFSGDNPVAGGLEDVVLKFLGFLGLCLVGGFLGFVTMVVLGKEWKTRGLAAYAERHGALRRGRASAPAEGRKR